MKFLPLFIILQISMGLIFPQDKPEVVVSKGKAQDQWYFEIEPKTKAEERVLQAAQVDALERAFGRVVVQGNSTFVKNVNSGQQVETQTTFNMIGNSFVGGEVIRIVNQEFKTHEVTDKKRKKSEKEIFITCNVEIEARKASASIVNFMSSPLSGEMKNNKTDEFFNNDDIYFFFKSPVSGYVSIYVDITGSGVTQRILPYTDVPKDFENGMPVDSDKEYIFFSKSKTSENYPNHEIEVDEIYASPDKDNEIWRFFVIFTTEPINKPALKKGKTGLSKEEIEKQITAPKELKSEDFQKWLMKSMHYREDFQRQIIDVSVHK